MNNTQGFSSIHSAVIGTAPVQQRLAHVALARNAVLFGHFHRRRDYMAPAKRPRPDNGMRTDA